MPQMAPMNWLILFIMFIIMIMMYNSMNYFSFKYKNFLTLNKHKIMKNSWKW